MSLNLTKPKHLERQIISTLGDFERHLQQKTLKAGFLLAGELVAEAQSATDIETPYLLFAKRMAGKANLMGATKSSVLCVGIHSKVLQSISSKKLRPVLLCDAIIKKGTHCKEDNAIYITMVSGGDFSHIMVYHFKKQTLVSQDEYRLPPVSSNTYEADIHHILETLRIRNSDAEFYWYGTSRVPRSQQMIELDDAIFSRVSPITAITSTGQTRAIDKYALPVGLVIAMAAYTGISIYTPYKAYTEATQALHTQVAQFPQEVVFSKSQLAILDAKKQLMSEGEGNKEVLLKFKALMEAFAQEPDVKIKTFTYIHEQPKVQTPSSGSPYDFEVVLSVPKKEVSMIEQSMPLLRSLSERTGTSLRLATSGGFKEEVAKGGSRRVYRIQGTL
jgi:hypothetical protein